MISLNINGKIYDVDVSPQVPLLWVIRESIGLTGTKYGCGISQCGICTVHVNGDAIRSCVTPASAVLGKKITTIEGLSADHNHPVQQAWIAEDAPQCGYCHSGQIMAAAALLSKNPSPSDEDIDKAMAGILCRCGTYGRIRRAIHRASELISRGGQPHETVRQRRRKPAAPFSLSPFVRISADEDVVIVSNKSEMGQGVYTALPMLVAEELECDWSRVRVESAVVDPVYNHPDWGVQLTGGSTSVPSEWERMRKVGAIAREMLIAAAADTWKADKASCRAESGMIIHSSGKTLSYGQLAEKASTMPVPQEVSLKDPSAFRIVGKPVHRIDTPEKVNGRGRFGIDARIPGMLTAVVARPPVFGGKVKSFNAEKAKQVQGVREVLEIESGVAVVADNFWSADLGRRGLEVVWDDGPLAELSTEKMRERYVELSRSPGKTARKQGDPIAVLGDAAKPIRAEYDVPYLSHATMEPLNCLVDLRANTCEIWTGTQSQTGDRDAAAQIAGLPGDKVKLHTTLLGGGFGRRGNPKSDFVVEAVEIAKSVGRPVKVIWLREDDIKGGWYRPMFHDRIEAGLDATGKPVAWHHTIVGQSILYWDCESQEEIDPLSVEGAREIPYEIPNILVDLHTTDIRVPVLWWRSVGHSHTAFVVESFMDEVAHTAGRDPFEFRSGLLSEHPRHRGVLDLAARKAGWGKPLPPGRARGIALHRSFGSFVAQVAEVSLDSEGKVHVHRVVCAIDCGMVVNPGIVEAQMESGIVFGLSAALYGAITFEKGRVVQRNFNDYPILRMNEMPDVEVHIVPSREPPSGVGEPGVPPIAPAVTNAIFNLTGKRIRRLPIYESDAGSKMQDPR